MSINCVTFNQISAHNIIEYIKSIIVPAKTCKFFAFDCATCYKWKSCWNSRSDQNGRQFRKNYAFKSLQCFFATYFVVIIRWIAIISKSILSDTSYIIVNTGFGCNLVFWLTSTSTKFNRGRGRLNIQGGPKRSPG